MEQITEMSVLQLCRALQRRELSSREITAAYLQAIAAKDGPIGAYLTVTGPRALAQADDSDARRAAGQALGPFDGVPVALKDNICTKGVTTTCASRMLEHFVPPYDAEVVLRLQRAGAVLLGKLNMDEFAMGSTNENSALKPCRNPLDTSRVPGGSSDGAAAAVAARLAPFALGSDTGGSIRQPAAFCGVVGMKPTYGAVSRRGLVAFASSLDQIGPLTRTVADNAAVLGLVAGRDPGDSTSLDHPWAAPDEQLTAGVRGMTVALPREFFGQGIAGDVAAAVRAAAQTYASLGAVVREVSLPALADALPAYYVLSSAEASSNLARFDGVKYGFRAQNYTDIESLYRESRTQGFGKEVKRRIMLGCFVLSAGYYDAYYKKALQVRTLVRRQMDDILRDCDLILSPVAPTTAYKAGSKTADPMEMYLGDIYTVPVNIAGVPALSLPCGAGADGMPVGMQLIGRPFSEPLLYRAAYAFEQNRGGAQQ